MRLKTKHMTRKECLDKIQEAVDNLDTLLAVIKSPSSTTIRWDCEVYADEADKITFGRRKLLHILAAGSGVLAALTILPDRWSQPIIEFVVLPAHAQTSNPEPPDEPLPADPLPPSPTTYTLAASADGLRAWSRRPAR